MGEKNRKIDISIEATPVNLDKLGDIGYAEAYWIDPKGNVFLSPGENHNDFAQEYGYFSHDLTRVGWLAFDGVVVESIHSQNGYYEQERYADPQKKSFLTLAAHTLRADGRKYDSEQLKKLKKNLGLPEDN